jgi:GT2 family glycosyltransferase
MGSDPAERPGDVIDLPRSGSPLVSVIMVLYGGWQRVREALEAVRGNTDVPSETVLVDNPANDRIRQRVQEEIRGATVVLNDDNVGFGPGANQGADRARGRYLVFLNGDTLVQPGWLEPLMESLAGDHLAGAAVPKFLNGDGTLQEAGGLVFGDGSTRMYGHGEDPNEPRYRFRRYVDYGSAACLAIRRSTFLDSGGFDPVYVPAYCEDVDLQFALRRRGLRTVYEPRSEVVHSRFGSSGQEAEAERLVERNTGILRQRWADVLAARPMPPLDATEHHRFVVARDADASDRILVLADRVPGRLLGELAARNRTGRVTYLATGLDPVPREALEKLLALGVEVEGPLREHAPWWRDRLFHYTAVVVAGPDPRWLSKRLHDTQPQASLIRGDDVRAAIAELRRVGLLAEADGSGRFSEPIR